MANKIYRKLQRKLNHIVRDFNEELAREYGGDIKIYQLESHWSRAYKDYLFCVMRIRDSSTERWHEFYVDSTVEKFAPKIKWNINDFIYFDSRWCEDFGDDEVVPKNFKRRN